MCIRIGSCCAEMLHIWVRVVKMAFASEDFYSEHLKAEDVCVCLIHALSSLPYRRDGWTRLSLVHMEDLDLVYTNTIF